MKTRQDLRNYYSRKQNNPGRSTKTKLDNATIMIKPYDLLQDKQNDGYFDRI